MLSSTDSFFFVTPLPMLPSAETEEFIKSQASYNLATPKSLIIDKKTQRFKEGQATSSETTQWVREILGILGILNIMGIEHLLVISEKGEVCRIPHKNQSMTSQCSVIYELQEVELIPFVDKGAIPKAVNQIAEGIKKFLECGFYFSYTIDLTANSSRRERYSKDSQ